MEQLNDPESTIYKETIQKQKEFISKRFKYIKNRYLDDQVGCCGEKDSIAKHLNHGPAQNLVHTFFNYNTKECMLCKKKKGEDGIRQFERAHCNRYSRNDLLLLAIDELYIDNTTPLKSGDILRLFIKKHDLCPIYMLCNNCHNHYDNHFHS
tara:strand:+ start:259 stop:714 length:456 start_codon:yes stop_codon:yes gene_type:complete